jgi:3-oxoacyl-[acyl-carrier protein] reductase
VSKAGILALTRQLAIELAPYVNVNSVLPGTTDTPTFRKFVRKDMIKKISKNTPIGRLGTPDDVARAVLFLASEDSCFMTGTSLDVNGGSVMI